MCQRVTQHTHTYTYKDERRANNDDFSSLTLNFCTCSNEWAGHAHRGQFCPCNSTCRPHFQSFRTRQIQTGVDSVKDGARRIGPPLRRPPRKFAACDCWIVSWNRLTSSSHSDDHWCCCELSSDGHWSHGFHLIGRDFPTYHTIHSYHLSSWLWR